MSGRCLICVSSWEERFVLSINRIVDKGSIDRIICISSKKYSQETISNRLQVIDICNKNNIRFEELSFDFENHGNLIRSVRNYFGKNDCVDWIFDISTAPRNLIWAILVELERLKAKVRISYSPALKYPKWHTAEEANPKIMIGRSGVMFPGQKTCLVMACGPDVARVERTFSRFEPSAAIILRDIHSEDYDPEYSKNQYEDFGAETIEVLFDNKDVSEKSIDQIISYIKPYIGEYNILCGSFGPKMSAITFFELTRRYDDIGLIYVPAEKYNIKEAATGIGEETATLIDFEL